VTLSSGLISFFCLQLRVKFFKEKMLGRILEVSWILIWGMDTLWILLILWLRLPEDVLIMTSLEGQMFLRFSWLCPRFNPQHWIVIHLTSLNGPYLLAKFLIADSWWFLMSCLNWIRILRVYLIFLYNKVKYNDLRVLHTVFMEINRNKLYM